MNEYRTISICMMTTKNTPKCTEIKERLAYLRLTADTPLYEFMEFQRDTKKIIREAFSLAKNGDLWGRFSITEYYNRANGCETVRSWDAVEVSEDDNGKPFIYFRPDTTTDTPDYWDGMVYGFESLVDFAL